MEKLRTAIAKLREEATAEPVMFAALALWLVLVCVTASFHELWRDEMRAFTIAIEPSSFLGLPAALRNDGHPILWFAILRTAHTLVPSPLILKVVAIAIGFCGVALFALRAPFPRWQRLLFAFGVIPLYEYSVMIRNYGISMLLLFSAATLFPQRRAQPIRLGVVLALLANTNVHSAILVIAITAGWMLEQAGDLLRGEGSRPGWRLGVAWAAVAAGVLLVVWVVMPDGRSSVPFELPSSVAGWIEVVASRIAHPGEFFSLLLPRFLRFAVDGLVVVLGLGLLIRPAVFASYFGALIALGVFHAVVYQAGLRHQGLYLLFVVFCYWIVEDWRRGEHSDGGWRAGLFRATSAVVLTIFLLPGPFKAVRAIRQDVEQVLSSNVQLAAFIHAREELSEAILIGEPDVLLESLPYYANNPIYVAREERFADRVSFTSDNQPALSLGELHRRARALAEAQQRPVLIAIGHPGFDETPAALVHFPYGRSFEWSEEDWEHFHAQTTRVARFDQALGKENYSVFLYLPTEASD